MTSHKSSGRKSGMEGWGLDGTVGTFLSLCFEMKFFRRKILIFLTKIKFHIFIWARGHKIPNSTPFFFFFFFFSLMKNGSSIFFKSWRRCPKIFLHRYQKMKPRVWKNWLFWCRSAMRGSESGACMALQGKALLGGAEVVGSLAVARTVWRWPPCIQPETGGRGREIRREWLPAGHHM